MEPFELFFSERYAAAHAAEQRREQERRAAAFLDVAEPVAAVPLRPLTPHDLFMLDGFASPFVCGAPSAATPEHIIAVLWLLRRARPPLTAHRSPLADWWSFRRHEARLLRRWRREEQRLADHAALTLWFENVFEGLSGDSASTQRPPPSHFLATLLVPLTSEMGHIDPVSGALLAHTPIARLTQYAQTLARTKASKGHIEFRASDKLLGDALAEWNALPPEQRAEWATRATAA